jgi:hypothetical protein
MLPRTTALFLLCIALAACDRGSTPEAGIRATVAAAEEAAESRDASALLALIAPDYQDGRGYNAEELGRHVRGYLIAHQSIRLLTRIDEIEILGPDLASLKATVGMLGRESGATSSWDLAGEVYEFDLRLAREGNDWRLVRASWRTVIHD